MPRGREVNGVCVYAPSTIVTVTVEGRGTDTPEIHFHAGGQGFWIARLLGRLGVPTTLCTIFGGESGRVARTLAEAEPIDVRGIETDQPNGAWIHDRRSGERRSVAEAPGGPVSRHAADELYGAALAAALRAGRCVLAGPHRPSLVPSSHFERLATDLRANDVEVIADLSGDDIVAALAGGIDFCKVSAEDLAVTDGLDDLVEPVETLRALQRAGARNAAVTRGGQGMFVALGDEAFELRPPKLQAIDPRGAGDAFTATVAAARSWGLDWSDAVRWGTCAGALTAVRRGLATADRREIHQLLDRVEVHPLT